MTHVLDVSELSVAFGTTEVFRGLTFSVEQGSSVAILGPNGCGKTILFKALVRAIRYQDSLSGSSWLWPSSAGRSFCSSTSLRPASTSPGRSG